MDRDRLEELWREHADAVHSYAFRRMGSGRADDVVVEVFIVAMRRQQAEAPTRAWLLGVAHNVIRHQHRAEGRRTARESTAAGDRSMGIQPPASDPDLTADHRLQAALAELSDLELEAIRLVAWDQLTPTEAAEVVGCSPAAFRVRLHRARRRLVRRLTPEEART